MVMVGYTMAKGIKRSGFGAIHVGGRENLALGAVPRSNGPQTHRQPPIDNRGYGTNVGSDVDINDMDTSCSSYANYGFHCVDQCKEGPINTYESDLIDIKANLDKRDPTQLKCPGPLEVCCRDSDYDGQPLQNARPTMTLKPGSCLTVDGGRVNVGCVFPFSFKGRTYNGCTTDDDPENRLWCSTRTDSNGVHISGREWGHCNSACRTDQECSCTAPWWT